MTLSQKIDSLVILLQEAKADADKFESGARGANPAGTRLRKVAQTVSKELAGLRKSISETKKAADAAKKAAKA